jgi:o-succinylbenzoate synthase
VDDVRTALAQGVRRIKIKIQPGWDLEPLTAIRRELGEITLLADANAAYSASQVDHLRQIDAFHLLMLEQPLTAGDIVDHAELRRRIRTPICLDESAEDFHMVHSALKIGAADIINIKVARVGGITESLRIHDLCRAGKIPVWCGRRTGSGISLASELAIASLPGFAYPTDHGVDLFSETEDHLVDLHQFRPQGATLQVPTGPGIGVEVDQATLHRITQHLETFSGATF